MATRCGTGQYGSIAARWHGSAWRALKQRGVCCFCVFWGVWFGGVLLSRTVLCAVPWALGVLAAGFGDGSGRVPPAMTTGPHTPSILWCLCLSRVLVVFGCVCGVFRSVCLWCLVSCVFGWVGCVVNRIVGVSLVFYTQASSCLCVCVCVCGLCWSISASQLVALAGCLRLVYLPSGLLGTFQPLGVVETWS